MCGCCTVPYYKMGGGEAKGDYIHSFPICTKRKKKRFFKKGRLRTPSPPPCSIKGCVPVFNPISVIPPFFRGFWRAEFSRSFVKTGCVACKERHPSLHYSVLFFYSMGRKWGESKVGKSRTQYPLPPAIALFFE